MRTAQWNNQIIAQSDDTVVVEGNVYFPMNSLKENYFNKTDTSTVCGWKGNASYFDIIVDGETNKDAAWYYPTPKSAAIEITNHVAFWKGIKIS